ncbi:MAG: hypothetical protein WBK55_09175 [Alphaproteobacteria bacterium]
MRCNVTQFLQEAGITEAFYPGKRLVHACRQEGQFKSHSVVLDWRDPDKVRIELRAGLTGKELTIKELKNYPVSFQTPTYVDIEIINDNKSKEDEEGKSSSGSGGGSSKGPKKSLESMRSLASEAFGSVREGKVPELGKIVAMVIMGTKVAAEAYGNVMGALAKQIGHAKIQTTDLLARAGDFVTKYTPPAFMAPTGDEQKVYKYDREKNADIGFRPGPG